jgi:hypothetical protein
VTEKTVLEFMVIIIDILSNLACSNDEQDEEDGEGEGDEDAELGKRSEDDEPGWVNSVIFQSVHLCIQRVWQNLMMFE